MSRLIPINREKLIDLYLRGRSTQEQLARHFGVSRTNIRKRLANYGIPLRPTPYERRGEARHEGYIIVYLPGHPRADSAGYVRRAIVAWETAHEQTFPEDKEPHHANGIKADDRPENIVPLTRAEHTRLESLQREHRRGYKKKNRAIGSPS